MVPAHSAGRRPKRGNTHAHRPAARPGSRTSYCNGLQLDLIQQVGAAGARGAARAQHGLHTGHPARSPPAAGPMPGLVPGRAPRPSAAGTKLRAYRTGSARGELDRLSAHRGPEGGARAGRGPAAARGGRAAQGVRHPARHADPRRLTRPTRVSGRSRGVPGPRLARSVPPPATAPAAAPSAPV